MVTSNMRLSEAWWLGSISAKRSRTVYVPEGTGKRQVRRLALRAERNSATGVSAVNEGFRVTIAFVVEMRRLPEPAVTYGVGAAAVSADQGSVPAIAAPPPSTL